ncbi:sodium bicarbonate transporter-like protein 11, partial [Dinothrombium tinctorium]
MSALPSLQKRHVAIARLKHPANMGRNSHEVRFFILVLTPSKEEPRCRLAQGLCEDLRRRLSHYISDYVDDIRKAIIGQTVGGLSFGFFGGQPLVIIMTTAPLCLYTKDFKLNYYSEICTVNQTGSHLSSCVFSSNSSLNLNLTSNDCSYNVTQDGIVILSSKVTEETISKLMCRRDASLLFLLLMLGTVWVAVSLYNFNKTPYLQASKRELLADYALPMAVIFLSFIGSYIFQDIPVEHFQYSNTFEIGRAPIEELPMSAAFAAMGLGFALSLLFFMDQNIAAAMVNNPCNKLKKGCAYHLDLFVVGILNGFLSLYGFPWMHGVLPHSPLHVRSLADVEERVDQGHVYEIIVRVRETRITGIISHILIGLSVFLLPYPLAYIPTAVLDGLFLYMAITALNGNQMFERITLLFMEQAAYPPNHYIRRCPQRMIHLFTLCQMIQLGVMCFFGFSPWPYVKMVFPVIILLLLPVR